MPDAPLAVVVLNWNGANDTLACLESLQLSTIPVHALVVDNGSTDDSAQMIEDSGLAASVVRTGENLGYAAGNNVGLRVALDDGFPIVVVLNNDTLVEPDALAALVDALDASADRAASPDVRYADRPEVSWFAGGVIEQGWPRHLQPAELTGEPSALRASEWLSGCCIAARSETWKHVGLFDEAYFLIFEDADWSLRAARAGVELLVAGESRIRHRVSSTASAGPSSLLSSFYFVRNGLRFERTYFPSEARRFARRWLVQPAPGLVRSCRFSELAFRWLGAAAFAAGQKGIAPRAIRALATRLR